VNRHVCIIQARLTSSRLPNKILLKIGEHEALWHVISRCWYAFGRANTVVAIPSAASNDTLASWLDAKRVRFIRGPEEDVWARYIIAALAVGVEAMDWIVRVTSDCPFVAPEEAFGMTGNAETGFVSNTMGCPPGMNVQCVRAHALINLIWADGFSLYDREHVLTYYDKPEKIVSTLPATHPTPWPKDFRVTLDTPADYAWFQQIAAEIDVTPPLNPTTDALLALFARRPDLIRTQGDYEREKAAADLR